MDAVLFYPIVSALSPLPPEVVSYDGLFNHLFQNSSSIILTLFFGGGGVFFALKISKLCSSDF